MSDQKLLDAVKQADPVSADVGEPPDALFERILAIARAEEETRPSAAGRHRRHQRARSKWVLAVGAAGTVALVAVIATVLLAADAGSPSPAAAAVLLRAAHTATKQPATGPPGPGQFVYTKSEGLLGTTSVPAGGQAFNTVWRYIRQQWIAPDGSGRVLQVAGRPRLATSADRAAWIADGKPNLDDGSGGISTPLSKGSGLYLDLSNLPTDPSALKRLIEQRKLEGGPPGEAETFTIIGDLLRNSYAPPAVRSALYTVAAQLPNITLIGPTHDKLGRIGTAVGYASNGTTHELILDPRTSALLAEQTVDSRGRVVAWTAYVSSAIVNSTRATTPNTP